MSFGYKERTNYTIYIVYIQLDILLKCSDFWWKINSLMEHREPLYCCTRTNR